MVSLKKGAMKEFERDFCRTIVRRVGLISSKGVGRWIVRNGQLCG